MTKNVLQSINSLTIEKIVAIIFLLFICFPYFQVIPIENYNQPYSLLFSFLVCFINREFFIKLLNKKFFFIIISFHLIGLFFFLLTCYPYKSIFELQYLVAYFTLTFITASSFICIVRHPKVVKLVFLYCTLFWLAVSTIQYFYNPSFLMTSIKVEGNHLSAENLLASGRGVLALAPEPTHHGFHILLSACILMMLSPQHTIIVAWCLIDAVFIAKSSSSLLVIALSVVVLLFYIKNLYIKVSLFSTFFMLTILFINYIQSIEITNDTARVFGLVAAAIAKPEEIITMDASFNSRIGGTYATFYQIFVDFYLPHGLSHETWMFYHAKLTNQFKWLRYFSETQSPSGIGSLLFQSGFLVLYQLYFLFKELFSIKTDSSFYWLKWTVFFIALSQLTFATPILGFIFALAVAKNRYKLSF